MHVDDTMIPGRCRILRIACLVTTIAVLASSCSSFLPGDDEAVIQINPPRSGESDAQVVVIGEPGADLEIAEQQLRQDLPPFPAEWNPDYVHLVDFVEEATGHDFRHRWHIIEESGPIRLPNDPFGSDDFLAFLSALDDIDRALGIPSADFVAAARSTLPTQEAFAFTDEHVIAVDANLPDVIRESAVLWQLIAVNQADYPSSSSSPIRGGDLNATGTLLQGEMQLVHQQWRNTLDPSEQENLARELQAAADLSDGTGAQRWAADAALGAAFLEQRQHRLGVNGMAWAIDDRVFLADLLSSSATTTARRPINSPNFALPAGADTLISSTALPHSAALTALRTVMPLDQALTAMQEVSTIRSDQWKNEDGQWCLALGLAGWIEQPFDHARDAFELWAEAFPELRSLTQPRDGQLVAIGCDPGPDAVPNTATFGETIAPLALLIRVESLALVEGTAPVCSREVILATSGLTLTDPALLVPLDELREHLPTECDSA